LDFYDAEHRVPVEVDGAAHHDPEQVARDERRDAYLHRNNVRVLRVSAWRVRDDLDLVVRWIVWKVREG
jgi:very-short-patch-repair endonuclease